MGGACRAYGREKRHIHGCGGGNLRERDYLGDTDVDGKIILRWIFGKLDVRCMDWIELVHGRDMWRALVNAVMNLRVS
jgi:hypothetical protein